MTNCKLKINHLGHSGYLNTVTVSPDGSLCASGGKDMKAMLWDLNDGKHLHTLDHNDIITALCFSPNRYWLCAAFGPSIKIWVGFEPPSLWKTSKLRNQDKGSQKNSATLLIPVLSRKFGKLHLIISGAVLCCNLLSWLNTLTCKYWLIKNIQSHHTYYVYYKQYVICLPTGPGKQGDGWGAPTRNHQPDTELEGWPTSVPLAGVVHWRSDPLRWILRQHHQSLAGFSLCSIRCWRLKFHLFLFLLWLLSWG